MRTSITRSSRIESNSSTSRTKGNKTRSKGKNKTLHDKVHAHTVAKTMTQLNVVRPRELALDVGLWIMPFATDHICKTKAIRIIHRGKQLLKIEHQLRTRQDHLSSNNSKADNQHRTKILVLHNSNRIEMHKGCRIGHNCKGGHTILIVLM